VAQSVYEWFSDSENRKLLKKILNHVQVEKINKIDNPKVLGKTFVFTGTMPGLDRDEAKLMVRKLGGEVSNTVSKNTNYVVSGESAGSKLDKAKELGIPILDQDQFLEMVN
jgi:DNA ligase (NAD+)